MWYNRLMINAKLNAKILTEHIFKHDKKQDLLHSSGYAQVQNGATMGASSAESFTERQKIDENRRFVKGYRNSRIMNEFYGVHRAREKAGYGRYGGREQQEVKSNSFGARSITGATPKRPTLGSARAPQIPTRRGGILR